MRAGWVAVASLGWATATAAPPVVLHDAGGTEPIAPYMAPYLESTVPSSRPDAARHAQPPQPAADALEPHQRLPVTSPGLHPGRLARDAGPAVLERLRFLSRPLCLVGAESASLQWLEAHRSTLRAAGAMCLAVEVPDEAAWARLSAVAKDLPLVLASGAELAETFGLSVYPVLIPRDGFEQ